MVCERSLFRSELKSKACRKVRRAPLAIFLRRVKHAHADILEQRPTDATESVPHPLFDRARHMSAAAIAEGAFFGVLILGIGDRTEERDNITAGSVAAKMRMPIWN